MSNWLLKTHLFLFYSSVACTIVYLTVYYKTYTDCSYHEIGLLCMLISLGGAFLKPLICSYADRHSNYKRCLALAIVINWLSTTGLAMVPFYPQLLFAEPHPRLIWYLVAAVSFMGHVCLSLVVTLSDVFVVQECLQSGLGEHFGQYRIIGGFGWALSSISVALAEHYIHLPYLALPLLASSLFLLIDLALLAHLKEIASRGRVTSLDGSRCGSIVAIVEAHHRKGAAFMAKKARPSIQAANPAISLMDPVASRSQQATVYATVEPDRLRKTRRAASSTSSSGSSSKGAATCDQFGPQQQQHQRQYRAPISAGTAHHKQRLFVDLSATRGSGDRISFMVQLDLLVRLSRYDGHHLIKYLILFVLMGAFNQTHYIFYFQYFTEILEARNLASMLFTLSALIQVSNCVGETVGLLWLARWLIDCLGRDISLLLAVLISGLRATIIGYLLDGLSVWSIAMLEIQTGLVYGISYTLMIESASSYLSLLDRSLLVEPESDSEDNEERESSAQEAAEFVARLEELKELYSIEAIRFAIRATVQGIFSGAGEGVGFAIGPLLAGIWLSVRDDSLETLYCDMACAHLSVLLAMVLVEFALMRLLLGSRSKIDRLMIGGGGSPVKPAPASST